MRVPGADQDVVDPAAVVGLADDLVDHRGVVGVVDGPGVTRPVAGHRPASW
jgi:hypothetical protein